MSAFFPVSIIQHLLIT